MTAEKRPDPPVAADVDLRGLEYMPLFGVHLFGSEFNAAASDAEWRAAITLWWAAWNQVPAGSLPKDDVALCRLADLGRDLKLWRKLKARALHGFVECSDGRLYHMFLCKQALIAWDKRVKDRERKAAWRRKQEEKMRAESKDKGRDRDGDKDSDGTGTETGTETGTKTVTGRGQDADVPADVTGRDVTGRDVTGREEKLFRSSLRSDRAQCAVDADFLFGPALRWLVAKAVPEKSARSLVGKLRKQHGDDGACRLLIQAQEQDITDPAAWLMAATLKQADPVGDFVRGEHG